MKKFDSYHVLRRPARLNCGIGPPCTTHLVSVVARLGELLGLGGGEVLGVQVFRNHQAEAVTVTEGQAGVARDDCTFAVSLLLRFLYRLLSGSHLVLNCCRFRQERKIRGF